ncbi:MAG: family 1 glycosylhydrolase, partial [Candidatus Acetothermia bacterium]
MLNSDDFLMGVSLSGFQFEMGGKERDTGTDWYRWCTDELNAYSGLVSGDSPGNGPNYWENYEKFHELAQEAGMDALRIGIEWSRVFPEETFGLDLDDLESVADAEAIDHYGKTIRDLKDRGMTVMVDLNHFSLPLWAHDPLAINRKGKTDRLGWADDGLPEEFAKYARFTVRELDEHVDYWSTMNEPNVVANLGYLAPESGFPPSIISPEMYERAFWGQIEAHNIAYKAMKKETDKPVGLIYSTVWFDGDETAEHAFAYNNFRFLDPIMNNCDFLGVNYYTRGVVERREEPIRVGSQEIDWRRLPGYGYGCEP